MAAETGSRCDWVEDRHLRVSYVSKGKNDACASEEGIICSEEVGNGKSGSA